MLQAETAQFTSTIDMVLNASVETMIVLVVIGVMSLASWFVIGLKWWQFRRIKGQGRRFFAEVGGHPGLREAYRGVMKLPPSPFSRLFREGITFYSELRPGAIGDGQAETHSLSDSQLEALKMVLDKEIASERDEVSHYVPWLASIGTVGPLMGLLGTVLGVMQAFFGIAAKGSGNIAAVAPGVAQALITTVAGLAVAIPSVMAYNYFATRVARFEGDLEGFGAALIGWMARERLL
ncbi:MAG: MotA/TolQ/ExbB proton channel family protein [Gemmatimonadota bacterium]